MDPDGVVTLFATDPLDTITTLPDDSTIEDEYFPTGLLKKRSGSQTPTVEYTYDAQGRLESMTTGGQAGPATTTWSYDSNTGRLIKKTYPGGDDIDYTYTDAGRLLTRKTDRNITQTRQYDGGGRDTDVHYSDSTPDVDFTLDRLGHIVEITDASGTRTRAVAPDGRVTQETYTAGPLAGITSESDFDAVLRRDSLTFSQNSSTLYEVHYTHDAASRLESVTNGNTTHSYTYSAHSNLISKLTTDHNQTPRKIVNSTYDNLERLTEIATTNGSNTISSHAYTYSDLNQRLTSELADGSTWHYKYDDMGQVTVAEKRHSSGAAYPGMGFGFAYDGIGVC